VKTLSHRITLVALGLILGLLYSSASAQDFKTAEVKDGDIDKAAVESPGGWTTSPWFGFYKETESVKPDRSILHVFWGEIRVKVSDTEGLWFAGIGKKNHADKYGWAYTDKKSYPWVYLNKLEGWVRPLQGWHRILSLPVVKELPAD